jgi:hypothetical protein
VATVETLLAPQHGDRSWLVADARQTVRARPGMVTTSADVTDETAARSVRAEAGP